MWFVVLLICVEVPKGEAVSYDVDAFSTDASTHSLLPLFRTTPAIFTMPPIRRYLRISKYSVLECRIFVEDPADAQRWLLNPRDPVLPRVFESVKPLILPKLREENDRAKGKGKKKKTVKDVVTEGRVISDSWVDISLTVALLQMISRSQFS